MKKFFASIAISFVLLKQRAVSTWNKCVTAISDFINN